MVTRRQTAERREEIETAVDEIVDTVERYFLIAPFEFIQGRENETAVYAFEEHKPRFNRFDDWADKWGAMIDREFIEIQEQLERDWKVIDSAVAVKADAQLRDALRQTHDAVGQVAFIAQKVSFYIGVFVGYKAMGASREQLQEKARGLLIPMIARAERREEAETHQRSPR